MKNEDRRFATFKIDGQTMKVVLHQERSVMLGFSTLGLINVYNVGTAVVLWSVGILVMRLGLNMLNTSQLVTLCCKEKDWIL